MRTTRLLFAAIAATLAMSAPVHAGRSCQEVKPDAATVQKALQLALRTREALDASGAPRELIDLAKRCLAPRPEDRPPDGTAVATAIDAYRDSVEKRMRAAETERAAQAARAEEAVRVEERRVAIRIRKRPRALDAGVRRPHQSAFALH